MMRKHYCENDVDSILPHFDEELFHWLGAAEHEYAIGSETVKGILRQFAGKVPKCNIYEEDCAASELAPDIYLMTGRAWVETDPSTNIYLRVHQRLSMVFRYIDGKPKCCHIHISNPYSEMVSEDVGFPTHMAKQSREYLEKCVEEQKQKIEEQTRLLQRLSYEDSLTGLYNRNKFNEVMDAHESKQKLGVAYFDINGLKELNDARGHSAGDDLIRRTAAHIEHAFGKKAYRIGGDEFVVIDDESDEDVFYSALEIVHERLEQDQIRCAIGWAWRANGSSVQEQFEEADKKMYRDKAEFYTSHMNDRRKR